MIAPVIDGAEQRVYGKGKYKVQLDIPPGSTLTESEVERILAMSSWEVQPTYLADAREGGRSLILGRAEPVRKGAMELWALQLTGVGYQDISIDGKIGCVQDDAVFHPPSRENFMERAGTTMRTSHAQGKKVVSSRPKYRAMGAYLRDELAGKVRNTHRISQVEFEKLATPNVEAYGWYLDDKLSNDDGPFGFAAFNTPGVEDRRAAEIAVNKFLETSKRGFSMDSALMACHALVSAPIAVLVGGLRELHEEGWAHLQTHMSNFYVKDGIPFLVDWSTMRRLGDNHEENILNRTIDLKRPADDYMKIFSAFFGKVSEAVQIQTGHRIMELVMEVYSGNLEREIHMVQILERTAKMRRGDATEFDMMAQWMKDQGFEGFHKVEYGDPAKAMRTFERRAADRQATKRSRHGGFDVTVPISRDGKKIARNAPCTCGSGKKFKRCCGR